MVMGAGPIGALSVAALVARGIGPVTVVEPGERRRELATKLGAEKVLDPTEIEIVPALGARDGSRRHAVHVVLECSGKRAAMETGFHQLRRGGTMALVGAGMEGPKFDPNRFLLNELHVVGSFVYDLGGFDHALELLASDGFPTDVLIEGEDVTLDRISDALVGLAEGRLAGKVMVVPWLSEGAMAAAAANGDS